ncbi:GNAT family N-acetyltransferase [Salinimicrobium sp. TH3]|uniref:GNAT family N-acetyltransferase n=1 Tax=Salinimicrobium sp. TH3 TaxID=2997342 RepID=UPI0022745AED|nr:GNAT family N-acetyltransferase [Salinimicrobium sp. TH3]MCY2688426.1 GNAT family N-acetyltransferase [Salinimicrobium sp. TH3]
MKIQNLAATPFEEVMSCFLSAFEGYFVTLPQKTEYWKERFLKARVDWELSFGMFDDDQLVGFIIHGVDLHNGVLTAYNTGTGTIPEYRGKRIIEKLYVHAIPAFKNKGVVKCLLEVIVENERARKVYERIGFRVTRTLRSFKGVLDADGGDEYEIENVSYQRVIDLELYDHKFYSWDNLAEAVKIAEEKTETHLLIDGENEPSGYFTIDNDQNILQLDSADRHFSGLLDAISKVYLSIQIKNVPEERTELVEEILSRKFENTINQYEMEMFL